MLIVISFAIIIVGYTLISHAFDLFLYPDPAFRQQIYAAADIDVFWFDFLVILVSFITVLGWLARYYADKNKNGVSEHLNSLWISFYALISREFYLNDIYAWFGKLILNAATRLNVLLGWR